MRISLFLRAFLLIVLAGIASRAQGALALQFSPNSTNVNVVAGSSTTIPIFVTENTFGTIAGDSGLFSVGFAMTADNGIITGLTGNTSVFDQQDGASSTSTAASWWGEQNTNFNNPATVNGNHQIQIGTLSITVPGTVGQVTHFTIGDFNVGTDETVAYNFTSLDSQINPGAFTVTTVAAPEPASLGLIVIGASVLLRRRR